MWQICFIFVSIGFVSCDTNCPNFDYFQHKPELLSLLDKDYMMVYTSSSYILECERISWTVGPNNNRTAELRDEAGCCRRIDNFTSSNQEYIEHDITPTSKCTRLQTTEKVRQKLVASTGSGTELNLCLIVYVCHPSRNGLLVVCRQLPNWSIWVAIGELIGSLLQSLNLTIPFFKTVNQKNCVLVGTCVY